MQNKSTTGTNRADYTKRTDRSRIKVYSSEIEKAYTVALPVFLNFYQTYSGFPKSRMDLKTPLIIHLGTEKIEQLWTSESVSPDNSISIKTRVRKTSKYTKDPRRFEPQFISYEATTKYEKKSEQHEKNGENDDQRTAMRIELNTPIEQEEYNLILSTFKKLPVEKLRLTFMDVDNVDDVILLGVKTDQIVYSADIYPEGDPGRNYVRIEIEFPSKKAALNYKPPVWLTQLLKDTEDWENGGDSWLQPKNY